MPEHPSSISENELNSFVIVPAGGAGRLDERRVYVKYSDGCKVSFARDKSVTVWNILEHHRETHTQEIRTDA